MSKVVATIQLGVDDLRQIVEEYIRPRIAGGEVVSIAFDYDTVQERFEGCTVTVALSVSKEGPRK